MCNNYNNCLCNKTGIMKYPTDEQSLYANKIYDNQIANSRCIKHNPAGFIEGFGCTVNWNTVLQFLIIVGVVFLVISFFNKKGGLQMGGFNLEYTDSSDIDLDLALTPIKVFNHII